MAELYRAWFDDDIPPLSGNDRFRMIHLSRNIFGSYEKAYFSYSLGIMGAPEWTRYERQICVQKERLDHHDVVQTVFDVLSDEFQSVIVKLCG